MKMCHAENWKVSVGNDLFPRDGSRDLFLQFFTRNNAIYLAGFTLAGDDVPNSVSAWAYTFANLPQVHHKHR